MDEKTFHDVARPIDADRPERIRIADMGGNAKVFAHVFLDGQDA